MLCHQCQGFSVWFGDAPVGAIDEAPEPLPLFATVFHLGCNGPITVKNAPTAQLCPIEIFPSSFISEFVT